MKAITLTKQEFKLIIKSEAHRIEIALLICKNSRRKTAKLLGISERTLFRKILRYGFPYKNNF